MTSSEWTTPECVIVLSEEKATSFLDALEIVDEDTVARLHHLRHRSTTEETVESWSAGR